MLKYQESLQLVNAEMCTCSLNGIHMNRQGKVEPQIKVFAQEDYLLLYNAGHAKAGLTFSSNVATRWVILISPVVAVLSSPSTLTAIANCVISLILASSCKQSMLSRSAAVTCSSANFTFLMCMQACVCDTRAMQAHHSLLASDLKINPDCSKLQSLQ